MNRNRLLMIGFVALALGAFVSLLVYRNLQGRVTADNRPGADVVVSTGDLTVGSKIEDKDIKVVRLPAADLPPHYYGKKSDVVGRGVVQFISQGEFVLPTKLAGPNAGYGMPSLIPPGMRAVSVRVNEVVSVAGFVQPGTRVDVLLTGNPGGAADTQTITVLENVAVLATGQRLERNAAGEASPAPVITLLVSPDDAQKLTLAGNQGRIQLSLRNPVDTKQEELASVKTEALYKNVSAPAPVPRPKAKRMPVVAPAAPPAPTVYQVEVIRGEKKDVEKLQ
ncbi:MAG TPA: Flp pilus assembly protein CpaB [Terriglobales bacterium]|nr:Flp pilus assembly protein CpaB [Terriglobales bacterium]